MRFSLPDSPGTLGFQYRRSYPGSQGTLVRGLQTRLGWVKTAKFSTNKSLYRIPSIHVALRYTATFALTVYFFSGVNPLTGTLKPQSNGPPLYSNTVIGTLAVDGWAVTFGTLRTSGQVAAPTSPSSLYQM